MLQFHTLSQPQWHMAYHMVYGAVSCVVIAVDMTVALCHM